MATNVLVVDDDPAIQVAIEKILQSEGYEVTVSPYLATLLSSAMGGQYDLITLDINMSGIDGAQVATSFQERGIDTRTVVVSGLLDKVQDDLQKPGSGISFRNPSRLRDCSTPFGTPLKRRRTIDTSAG